MRSRSLIGHQGAIVVANPLPADEQLDPEQHNRALARALQAAEAAKVIGKEITPFLLEFIRRETDGTSLQVNVRLVRRNAQLAAQVAAAHAAQVDEGDACLGGAEAEAHAGPF